MKIDKKIVWIIEGVALFLTLWSIAGIAMNTGSLSDITVTLNPEGTEHRDKTIIGVGREDEPPDYQLRIKVKSRWKDLGTYGNTWIGDGLAFSANDNIPLHQVGEIQLLDLDKLESDLLEQIPFEKNHLSYQGNNYSFQVTTRNEIESGFAWFFTTPIGIAILTGITIGIIIIILSILA